MMVYALKFQAATDSNVVQETKQMPGLRGKAPHSRKQL